MVQKIELNKSLQIYQIIQYHLVKTVLMFLLMFLLMGKIKYQSKLLMKDKDLKKKTRQEYLKDFIVIDLKNLENIQAQV